MTETDTTRDAVLERLGATRHPGTAVYPVFYVMPQEPAPYIRDSELALWVLERMRADDWSYDCYDGPGLEPLCAFWQDSGVGRGEATADTLAEAIFKAASQALGLAEE